MVQAFSNASRRSQAEAYVERAITLLARNAAEPDGLASLETAVSLAPSWPEPRYRLAHAYRMAGDAARAESMVREALEADPQFAPAAHLLGQLLCEHLRYVEAVGWLRLAVTEQPDNAEYLRDLGFVELFMGQIPSARRSLLRSIELNPHSHRVLPALVRMTRMGSGSTEARRLFKILRDLAGRADDLPLFERVEVLFALGRALEERGEYDKAFDALARANSLHRSQIQYDVAQDEARFAEIARIFSSDLIGRLGPLGSGSDDPRPIFIVGMPRSGSTLVEQIVSAHPDIHGAGEIDDLRRIVNGGTGPAGSKFPQWAEALTAVDLRNLGQLMLNALPPGLSGQSRVTVKRLDNFEYLGLIHLCLPKATIIHCRRDPRDSCFSAFGMDFQHGQDFSFNLAELGRYWRAYNGLMNHWNAVLPQGRVLDVPYEALVGDLNGWTGRLLAHCGLNWDDACLNFHTSKRIVRSASVAQVREPIFTTSIGRWKPFASHLAPLLEWLDN